MLKPSNLADKEVVEPKLILKATADEQARRLLREIENEYWQLLKDPMKSDYWRSFSEMELWLLLCRCILSSEVRDEIALYAVTSLWERGQLNPYLLSDFSKKAKKALAAQLSTLLSLKKNSKKGQQYSQDLVENAKRFRKQSISWLLQSSQSEAEARENLCSYFQGVGFREASLFLRASGYASELVVVDEVLVRFLKIVGWAKPSIDASQINPKSYRLLEYIFRGFCEHHGIDHRRMEQAIRKILRKANQ